jgi:hypothetical protein
VIYRHTGPISTTSTWLLFSRTAADPVKGADIAADAVRINARPATRRNTARAQAVGTGIGTLFVTAARAMCGSSPTPTAVV